jgi:hypothetical protein
LYPVEQTFVSGDSAVYNSAVRSLPVVLAALALAGCGDDTEVEVIWGGPPDPGPGGVASVNGFASFQESVDAHWERSAVMTAAEFLRLDERTVQRTTIEGQAAAEGRGPQTVVVTLDGLLDDSVAAERWTLGFDEADGVYRLTAALRELRCQAGRGHAAFAPEPCT